MRAPALLLLVFLGCGQPGRARTPADGSERGGQVEHVVERAAVEICRCGHGGCADAAVERMQAGLEDAGDVMLTSREQAAMEQAVARIDRCRGRLFGRGEQAARVAERWAEETCACTHADCRELAARRGAAELRRYGDARASETEVHRIVVASRRVRGCMRR